uniref:Uncharacterized protein n=1 Tax=Siphoviridae sp. ctE6L85 TaxID=2826202 RepID=A0A8S5QRB6_9CAUD|nr:MAG TPA: hypothetical protein [Siphoviridae sp. ctE6L85]
MVIGSLQVKSCTITLPIGTLLLRLLQVLLDGESIKKLIHCSGVSGGQFRIFFDTILFSSAATCESVEYTVVDFCCIYMEGNRRVVLPCCWVHPILLPVATGRGGRGSSRFKRIVVEGFYSSSCSSGLRSCDTHGLSRNISGVDSYCIQSGSAGMCIKADGHACIRELDRVAAGKPEHSVLFIDNNDVVKCHVWMIGHPKNRRRDHRALSRLVDNRNTVAIKAAVVVTISVGVNVCGGKKLSIKIRCHNEGDFVLHTISPHTLCLLQGVINVSLKFRSIHFQPTSSMGDTVHMATTLSKQSQQNWR